MCNHFRNFHFPAWLGVCEQVTNYAAWKKDLRCSIINGKTHWKMECPVNTTGLFINLSILIIAIKHVQVIIVRRCSLFENFQHSFYLKLCQYRNCGNFAYCLEKFLNWYLSVETILLWNWCKLKRFCHPPMFNCYHLVAGIICGAFKLWTNLFFNRIK